jgi:predicted Co/Zn/Cd cation transporter (cation efflux family)
MKKPLTFCLFTTIVLIVMATMDNISILTLEANVYDAVQLFLAVLALGVATAHLTRRYRRQRTSADPLIIGIVGGMLAAVVSIKNPGLGVQAGGMGSLFAHTAVMAMALNALLCLLSYVELDSAEGLQEAEGPMIS